MQILLDYVHVLGVYGIVVVKAGKTGLGADSVG
jgi:hypothetical protein